MVTRRDTTTQEVYIGATIVVAVLLISGMVLMVNTPSGMFADHYVLVARLSHVQDLREGAPVRLAGIRIGKVREIRLSPDSRDAEVDCQIDTTYNLPVDSRARIATAGLVGDSFLEIIRGERDTMLPKRDAPADDNRIEGDRGVDLAAIVTQTQNLGQEIAFLAKNLNDIVGDAEVKEDLRRTIANASAIADEAGRLVNRFGRVVDRVEMALDNVVAVTEDVRAGSGEVKAAVIDVRRRVEDLFDDRVTTSVRKALANLDGVTAVFERRRADLEKIIVNAADFSDRLAEVGRSLDGEKVNRAVDDVAGVAARAKRVFDEIDPKAVGQAVSNVASALTDVGELVVLIRREIVLALAINKAADRIVAQKFKEMQRQPDTKTADGMLQEVTRWFQDAAKRGYLADPDYPDPGRRPYMHEY